MSAALLVIDFQNAIFIDPPAYQAELILERIRTLIGQARQAGVPVIYIQHDTPDSAWQAGTATWEFPAAIAPRAGDHVSAKTSCDAFRHTGLERHLLEHGIDKLYLCGYATEFCVDTNVRRAAGMGLQTVVVTDAHTTRDRPHLDAQHIIEHHNWVWGEFSNPGNTITLSKTADVNFGA